MTGLTAPPGGLSQHLADELGALLGPDFPPQVGLAVSGGGDSMAMLHLVAGWARPMGVGVQVVTVDHGLRRESAAEAALVAEECAGLGLPQATLTWDGWDGQGNLQDAARQARLRLIGDWPDRPGHVLFAHTQDDQAETLLMRLARGSGVDGLAAMAARRDMGGWQLLRPLLGVTRAELRHYADTLRIPYVDDPSNADPAFARVRMRHMIGQEGLDCATLAETAQRMARAKTALERRATDVWAQISRPARLPGTIELDADALPAVEDETLMRITAAGLMWLASSPYRPRAAPLQAAVARMRAGGTTTLQGGMIIPRGARVILTREWKAVAQTTAAADGRGPWDSRWNCDKAAPGCTVRALGETGLQALRDANHPLPQGLPQQALMALPGVWRGADLVACSPLGYGDGPLLQPATPFAVSQNCLGH